MKNHASMNRMYRLVWSQVLNAWVAVSENAKGHGKSISGRKLMAAVLAFTASGVLGPMALAGPNGGQVSAGTGSIAQAGANTTITQSSQNLAINWQGFSIAANEAVRFNQPNATAIALNRVLGQDPSQILGSLSANGQVFVLNPNGVLFGTGSQVNVGGLVASSLSLSDADFMAGKHSFSQGGTAGAVVNQGTLTAAQGGYIALLAPEVRNEGVIRATLGTALLAAGDKVTLTLNNGSLLSYSIDQGALKALAENKQLIQADGGQVFMSAKAANALSTAMVNNTGIIQARTVQNVAGVIKLMGDMQVGTVNVGGTLDASAPNGGNGGFIETSAAHVKIANDAKVTTAAPNGNSGTWLIDPYDFTIAASGGDITGATLGAALGAGAVVIQTLVGSVSCTGATCGTGNAGGNGDIFVNDVVSWSANRLTLNAYRNININANLNASVSASLALEYGQGAVAAGNTSNYILAPNVQVNLPAGPNFSTKLGSDGVAKNFTVITSLGEATDATGGAATLQGMAATANLATNYVLGSNIDATATSTWNGNAGYTPIGKIVGFDVVSFNGIFDGLGHTISNLAISLSATNGVGLFGVTGTGSVIRNVGLVGGSVSGTSTSTFVGGLVGYNQGTISNSYTTRIVSGYAYVGGLVGFNFQGTISNGYAAGSVSGPDFFIGGLVGYNQGTISNAYATGGVSGGARVGGLVGDNYFGTISNTYATGSVASSFGVRGGLLGANNFSTVSNSFWDTGTSGLQNSAGGTGLTTVQMMSMASFTGFNIVNTGGSGATWRIYEGQTTPWLMWWLKPLTVTANADSKTYSGTPYSGGNGVTYSVASPNPALSGTLGYSGTSQSAVNAGSYTLGASGLYSVQQGYDISYVAGALTINKAPATVTANSDTKTYTGLSQSVSGFTASGLVNSETASVLSGVSAGASGTNAGSYTATAGVGSYSGNYTLSFVNGNLTINKAPATVTADNKTRLYGEANPALSTTVSGFLNGETAGTAAGFTGSGNATTTAGLTTGVGSAAITAGTGTLAASNYAFTNLVNGNLTINPAEIITPVAGGILPAVVEAIIALPGGADLLPMFSSTVSVAATQIDAVAPPPVLSNLQYVYVTTTTPGTLSGDIDTTADGKAIPTKAQGSKSDGFNERLSDAPIQFTGTVLVRTGGIRLPSDADGANARETKSGSN